MNCLIIVAALKKIKMFRRVIFYNYEMEYDVARLLFDLKIG